MTRREAGYWNYDLAKEVASNYNSRSDFEKNERYCYIYCSKQGFLDSVCSHMNEIKKPKDYWCFERCHEEALLYETKKDFRDNSASCYSQASRNKWVDLICGHMKSCGSLYFRDVYLFEFPKDRVVYVGLSCNIKKRYKEHTNETINGSRVYDHIQKTNSEFIFKVITEKPIPNEEAQILEHETIETYQNNGWEILNKGKTGKNVGSLGSGIRKWTFEKCQERASMFNSKQEYRINCSSYQSAKANGWLNIICENMTESNIIWNKQLCETEASKYEFKKDFLKYSNSAYRYALKHNFLDEICKNMTETRKCNNYWCKSRCLEQSLLYNNRSDFKNNSGAAYYSALRNGWLSEFCERMDELRKPKGYWTIEICKELVLNCEDKAQFKKEYSAAFCAAERYKWMGILFPDTIKPKPRGYWNNKENCLEFILMCNTRNELQLKYPSIYQSLRKNSWLDEFFPKQPKTSPN